MSTIMRSQNQGFIIYYITHNQPIISHLLDNQQKLSLLILNRFVIFVIVVIFVIFVIFVFFCYHWNFLEMGF